MIPQGYPLQAEMGGRWYHVVGWRPVGPIDGRAVGVPVDHRDGAPGAFQLNGVITAWRTPEPARELAAEVLGVLDEFSETRTPEYGSDAHDLVRTLRALLAAWAT